MAPIGGVALACFVCLLSMLNVYDAWQLSTVSRTPVQTQPPPLEQRAPPPPPVAPVSTPTASWFVSGARTRRIARVSSVRAQDVSLFRELGLETEVASGSSTSGGSKESHDGSSSAQRQRAHGARADASDLLLLPWRLPAATELLPGGARNGSRAVDESAAASTPTADTRPDLATADVLWGQWTSNLQFFDRRLRAGQMVNTFMGLEHETLGTPRALARSHQRCVRMWGLRTCNFTSAQLVLHSHRDVARLASLQSEDELADLSAWRDVTRDDVRSVWLAKRADDHRSLVHTRASMFDDRHVLSNHDPIPAGLWILQPWPTHPMLWRHHRFFLRTWLALPSVLPLRVYMLQDAWAHVVAKPYRADRLMSSYQDRCVHLWSTDACSVTHAHRIIRSNHEAFLEGLVGVVRGGVPFDDHGDSAQKVFWQRRVWPWLEDAATRAVASVWRDLARYESLLRESAAAGAIAPYRRVALVSMDWVIDEGGKPVLVDVDVDGAVASDELPLSHQYALDALRLLGVAGYAREAYAEPASRALDVFCARQAHAQGAPCAANGTAALMDLIDEGHHAGAFARIFPPAGGRGCGHYCDFFEAGGDQHGAQHSRLDRLTWAFLKAHSRLLPPRARVASIAAAQVAAKQAAAKEAKASQTSTAKEVKAKAKGGPAPAAAPTKTMAKQTAAKGAKAAKKGKVLRRKD